MIIFVIVFLVLAIILYFLLRGGYYLRRFSRDSLIVFGKKGHGKSLLFSVMAKQSSKKFGGYLSNTRFNFDGEMVINPNDINLFPNKWENVLTGNVTPVQYRSSWEGKPVFLDDCGIYLPNFADSTLKKLYPSLPISLAVWRHLYNAPIHVNSQDVERTWKMVREQADGFLKARFFGHLGPVGWIKVTYFEKIESARQDLAPMRKMRLNKYARAEQAAFEAEHGLIKDFTVFLWLPHHTYDSRYFRKVFFGPEIGQDSDSALPACTSGNSSSSPFLIDKSSKSQAPTAKPDGKSIQSARSGEVPYLERSEAHPLQDQGTEGSEGCSGNPSPSSFVREREKGEGN